MTHIHAIRHWDGRDEQPICGAVPRWNDRTIYHDHVTCPACVAQLAREQAEHDAKMKQAVREGRI